MRCRLSIILLAILLAGCTSTDSTVEPTVNPPTATAAATETPTLTFTPTIISPTATSMLENRTPGPILTSTSPVPSYDPSIIKYQEGVSPLTAHRRLGMGFIQDVQVSPDRQSFAVGTTTGVYVFDSQTLDLLWSAATRVPIEETGWFTFGGIKWSPSGDKLAAALRDTNSILIWAADGQFLTKLETVNTARAFAWSPDGEQIVTGQSWLDASYQELYGTVTTWNVETGEESGFYEIDTSENKYDWFIEGLRWSPDSRYILVGTRSEHITLVLDLDSGSFLKLETPENILHADIEHFEFSPDGHHLLSYSGLLVVESPVGSKHAVIWDMESLEMAHALSFTLVGRHGQVADASWSPNGQYIAALYAQSFSSSYFVIWDAVTGENLFTYEAEDYRLDNLDWSPDGTTVIVTGSTWERSEDESSLLIVDLSDMNQITIEKEAADLLELSGWLSDDKLLVASNEDLFVRDMPTDQYTDIIQSGRDVTQLAQSPDGAVIAALQSNWRGKVESVVYWDTQTWEHLDDDQEYADWFFSNGSPDELAAAANYTYILEQSPSTEYEEWEPSNIKLLDSGRTILDYTETNAFVYSNAVSSDGRYIAFGFGYPECYVCQILCPMEQAYILLFDTETETYVTLYGHTGRVTSLLFLPDGDLVSGSADGTIIVWDIP